MLTLLGVSSFKKPIPWKGEGCRYCCVGMQMRSPLQYLPYLFFQMFLPCIDFKRQLVHLCSVANFEDKRTWSQMKDWRKECLKEVIIYYVGGASILRKKCRKNLLEINWILLENMIHWLVLRSLLFFWTVSFSHLTKISKNNNFNWKKWFTEI